MAAESNYNYPLTTGQRGKIYISKSDPRNTTIGKAKLSARYGEGNVIVVPDWELLRLEGATGAIEQYTSESSSPIILFNLGITGTPPSTGIPIGLNPPTNLSVLNAIPQTAADGTVTMEITVQFDDIKGAQYESYVVTTNPSFSNQAVVISSSTVVGRTISVNWQLIPNANNYVLSASTDGINYSYANAPYDEFSTSGTINVLSAGSYTVTVTPYNSEGYAGSPGVYPNVAVA